MILNSNSNVSPTICLLHGYGDKKERLLSWFDHTFGQVKNPILAIDSAGSGGKHGTALALIQTQTDWVRIINRRKEPCVLIGFSMGGFNALCLTPNQYILRTITISAPTSNLVLTNRGPLFTFYYFYLRTIFQPSMKIRHVDLEQFEILSAEIYANREIIGKKAYMCHGIEDLIVPYDHFRFGKRIFGLKPSQYQAIRGNPFHNNTIYDKQVESFIHNALKPYLIY